jgi:zinc/manganese transport system substrate-binding protein
VEVKSLAKSGDNYHFLDARPDFILAIARADLLCRVGAELEIGWLPKALERAANSKVMAGGAGDCDLSRAVELLEKPNGPLNRSMGDVHAGGNPHFWLSPLAMAAAAGEVETRLAAVAPEKAADFARNRAALVAELRALASELKEKLKPVAGRGIYQYHKDFAYFADAYGLRLLGSIEEIPGVSPSAARLGQVSLAAKSAGSPFALASDHDPRATLAKFTELSSVPVVSVPTALVNPAEAGAYRKWQETIVAAILAAKAKP